MANEKRLIDANELLRDAEDYGPIKGGLADMYDVKWLVDAQFTVEAVEVVHCCDCQNCTAFQQFADSEVILFCEKWKGHPKVDPTDFCSYGERREGE